MNLQNVIAGLNEGLVTATKIATPLAALGVPYAGVAKSLLEVAQNVEQRIADGAVVATSTEHEQVKQIIVDLQAANDRLNAEIEDS